MKILGLVGSMRKEGNTNLLVETVLESARKADAGVGTKIIQISDLKIEACLANDECDDLCSAEPFKCVIADDLDEVLKEMKSAEAIVIGSPLYFKIPSRLTAFCERLDALSYFYGIRGFEEPHPLRDKPCGFVAVAGGDDPKPVLEYLFDFASHLKMKPITLKSYPCLGVGGKGKIEEDKDLNPIENAKILGELLVKAIRV